MLPQFPAFQAAFWVCFQTVFVYFQTALKEGFNPKTDETVQVKRQILYTDFELPLGDDYGAFVLERIV